MKLIYDKHLCYLENAILDLKKDFIFTAIDNLCLKIQQSSRFYIEKTDNNVVIEYVSKNQIFKALGELLSLANDNFSRQYSISCEDLAVMIDCSRNAVMTIESLKQLIRFLAVFGYNQLHLYIEDIYELDNEPFFGYLRGRYTKEQLKEIDDYAFMYGIEVVPCIQTIAHLNQIFRWKDYAQINDCEDILLVGEDRTYDLIEKMLSTMADCFRTHNINIGFDEAHMVGSGKYFDKHGYRNRGDILIEHLNKVIVLAKKYHFSPIMWSDMFFKLLGDGFYYNDLPITKQYIDKVPKDVALCYWCYYCPTQQPYDKMMERHKLFPNEIWFAGGTMSWHTFAPMNKLVEKVIDASFASCKKYNIKHYVYTDWNDGGGECPICYNIPSLYYLAEHNYNDSVDKKEIKDKFGNLIGISYDEFIMLDYPNLLTKNQDILCNPCKYILYNDYFCGVLDKNINLDKEFFKENLQKLRDVKVSHKYEFLFETMYSLMKILYVKYDIITKLRPAYKNNDYDELKKIIQNFDLLIEFLEEFYDCFKKQWFKINKAFGFDVQEIHLGGLLLRTKSCKNRLADYLEGKISKIEELEQDILLLNEYDNMPFRFNDWKTNVSVNIL